MIAVLVDRPSLAAMDAAAAEMQTRAEVALAMLREDERERAFALALLRHAKGIRAAVAAWQQELRNLGQ
jgi:hypothetical protein